MPARDSASLKDHALQLRQQGFSLRQIGRRLGVHTSVVGRWVRDVPAVAFNDQARAEQLGVRRDATVYQQARALRHKGWSYAMIAQELGVSKSTLSGWLRHESSDTAVATHRSREARIKAGATKRAQHAAAVQAQAEAAAHELTQRFPDGITERELFVAGLMLYWAEGDKTQTISVTNSDPTIIKVFILWLRQCFSIQDTQLRCEVHLYPDVDIETSEQYWSEITGVQRSQFYPAQVDMRTGKSSKKGKKLPHGTIYVKVVGKGTVDLHRKVLGWIAGFASLVVQ